eukprot:scaffold126165_cov35-Attheya_sp.AAC.2
MAMILDSKAETSTCKAANHAGHFISGLCPALMIIELKINIFADIWRIASDPLILGYVSRSSTQDEYTCYAIQTAGV